MSLPDFLAFENLTELRRKMGADLIDIVLMENRQRISIHEIEQLSKSGLEIQLDKVTVLEDGTLAYKDCRVVLYIRDVSHYDQNEALALPKYHVSNCPTLERMRYNNRFDRYVVATREDGLFEINIMRRYGLIPKTTKLNVCQFCLSKIGWSGFIGRVSYDDRKRMVSEFSLREFFLKFGKSFVVNHPNHTAFTAPINVYSKDFPEISDRLKRQRGFRCEDEQCSNQHIDFSRSQLQKYVHVHHKNALKYDNSDSNLKVVCIECHSNEHSHGHMKNHPSFQEFLAFKKHL